jgi:putative two-component system response regulator
MDMIERLNVRYIKTAGRSGGAVAPTTTTVRVLLAASDEPRRGAIADTLREQGYDVREADSGTEALQILRSERFSVLLCAQWMPVMSGLEVVPAALAIDSDIAIVLLNDGSERRSAAELLGSGAYDYLKAPASGSELVSAVERAARRRLAEIERRAIGRAARETAMMRTVQIERERASLRGLSLEIVQSLINMQEAKDPYLRGHSERVASLAARIAEELRLSPDHVEMARVAGKLHDVGMIGIPEHIIAKAGALTAEEFLTIQTHVDIGVDILAPAGFLGDALTYVRDHHEHFDGTGYPRGLAGNAISLGGRIIAAADAYDALTSARPFRDAFTQRDAMEVLGRKSGKLLDPEVYNALVRVMSGRRGFRLL